MDFRENIDELLAYFKQGRFIYGEGCLGEVGDAVAAYGTKAVLIRSQFPGIETFVEFLRTSLKLAGVELINESVDIVRPNAPEEDMYKLVRLLEETRPDVVISMGGGSTIDAVKAAIVLNVLGGEIEDYFGMGKVSEALESSGKMLTPHVAIQTAASSAAHLTKYSNITNLEANQKKLIVDEAIVPQVPVFDYAVTYNTPAGLTLDGALDGMSHCLEVYFGASGKAIFTKAEEVATIAISLVVKYLPLVMEDPGNKDARNALCAACDMGGYAIMIGGTSGAHLTSFSLVDLLSHGRACALMNPYYAVFYAPAIQDQLRVLGNIYKAGGFSEADFDKLSGRELGLSFAGAMIAFAKSIGFPTTLGEIDGFAREHTERALEAAKNPQLKSKLENMPVPLTSELVDVYMGSILEAARSGELETIKNL